VITSKSLFQVRFGRLEIGFVHPLSFAAEKDHPTILALGGRGWRIAHLDWDRKIAHVEPAQESGRSRWMGSSVPLSLRLCAAIRAVLESAEQSPLWSRRAADRISELRQELAHCCGKGTVIVRKGTSLEWWTFAGLAANQTVVQFLRHHIELPMRADNLWITLPSEIKLDRLNQTILALRGDASPPNWDLQEPASDLLKFGDLLPENLLRDLILARIADISGARRILGADLRAVDCE
jgi:ATP-dependent helicase Lhr and Lhr-like helicase